VVLTLLIGDLGRRRRPLRDRRRLRRRG